MSISQRIREIIDQNEGGNMAAAARRLGCSPSALQKICAGDTVNPRSDLLVALVRVYDVDPAWLLLGSIREESEYADRRTRSEAIALLEAMLSQLRGKGSEPISEE